MTSRKVPVYIIISAVLFATMEVALKIAGNSFDAFQLTFLRFLIGGLFLVPFAVEEARKRPPVITGKDFGWVMLTSFVGIVVSMVCFQLGVAKCNAATSAGLICSNPIFTMVIAHFFTSEKMTNKKWMSFCIGIVAITFLICPWKVQEGNTPQGCFLLIFAAITFATYAVMGKKTLAKIGTFTQTSIGFIGGAAMLLVILLVTRRPVVSGIAENWKVMLYCGIVVTGLGYMFYFLAVRYSDAITGSITFFMKPAIAPFFAMLVLHESIAWNTIVGVILMIIASVITLRDNRSVNTVSKAAESEFEHEIDGILALKGEPQVIGKRCYYASFIPLVEKDGTEYMLFVERARAKGHLAQAGELDFPTGRIENGEAPVDRALSEIETDLGIGAKDVYVIQQMDTIHGPTGVTIYTFVGRVKTAEWNLNTEDISDTMLVPVDYFVNHNPEIQHLDIVQVPDEEFSGEKIEAPEGYSWSRGQRDVPVYTYAGRSIWGVAASMVMDVAEVLKAAKKKR